MKFILSLRRRWCTQSPQWHTNATFGHSIPFLSRCIRHNMTISIQCRIDASAKCHGKNGELKMDFSFCLRTSASATASIESKRRKKKYGIKHSNGQAVSNLLLLNIYIGYMNAGHEYSENSMVGALATNIGRSEENPFLFPFCKQSIE